MFAILLIVLLILQPSTTTAYGISYRNISVTVRTPDLLTDNTSAVFFGTTPSKALINTFFSAGFSVWFVDGSASCGAVYVVNQEPLVVNTTIFWIYGNNSQNLTVVRKMAVWPDTNLWDIMYLIRYAPCKEKAPPFSEQLQWSIRHLYTVQRWSTGFFYTSTFVQALRATEENDKTLQEMSKPLPYEAAKAKGSMNSKYYFRQILAIYDEAENSFIGSKNLIGWICARAVNGTYVWDCGNNTGKALSDSYTAWGPGEPKLPGGCVFLDEAGVWVTKDCESEQSLMTRGWSTPDALAQYGDIRLNVEVQPTNAPEPTNATAAPTPNATTTPVPTNATSTPPPPTKRVYRRITVEGLVYPVVDQTTDALPGAVTVVAAALGGASVAMAGKATMGEMIRQMYSCGTEEVFKVGVAIHPTQINLGKPESYGMHLGASVMDLLICFAVLVVYYLFNKQMAKEWGEQWPDKFPYIGLVGIIYFYQTLVYCGTRVMINGKGQIINHAVGGIVVSLCLALLVATRKLCEMPHMELLTMSYRDGRTAFVTLEMSFQFIFGVVMGVVSTSETFCDAQLGVLIVTLIAHAGVVMFLNIMASEYEKWIIFLVDLLFATSCVAIAVGDSARKVADATLVISNCIFTLYSLARIAFQFRRFRRLLSASGQELADPINTTAETPPVEMQLLGDDMAPTPTPPAGNPTKTPAPRPKKTHAASPVADGGDWDFEL